MTTKKNSNSTLNHISELLNLSVSTVSRALNGQSKKYRISEKTTELIIETARKLNYEPNQLARGLRLKRTDTVGVIVPDITNPFFADIVRWIENAAREQGVSILISDSNDQNQFEKSSVNLFVGRKIDGLIISPIGNESAHIIEAYEKNIPIVLIDRNLDDLQVPFVGSDNYQGAKEATLHLIERGHTKIGFVQGYAKSSVNQDRLKGYQDAHEQNNLPVQAKYLVGDNFREESGYIATKLLLNANPEITAIFAASNTIALGAIKAIHEEKLRLPEDISIVSFDDLSYCSYFSPPLTSVAQQTKDIGFIAYRLLSEMIEGKEMGPEKRIKLPTQLIIRDSVRDLRSMNLLSKA